MLENLKENKRLVYFGAGGILIVIIIILLLVVVTRPSGSSTTNNLTSAPIVNNNINVNTDTNNNNGGSDNTGKVTINWWGVFLSEKDVQPLIDKYEAENENVDINYTNQVISQSEIESYQTKVLDVLSDSSGSAPDLIMIDNGWAGLFQPALEPAPSNIITSSQVNSDFYSFVSTDFVDGDKVYGLPLWVDTLALVYNTDDYKANGLVSPDADWQKFAEEQVPALTKTSDNKITKSGFSAASTSNTEFWFETTSMLMLQNKADVVGADGKANFGDDTDAQDAVDFYKQFADTNKSWDNTFNLDTAAFLEGKLSTYLAPSWRLNDIVKYNDIGNLSLSYDIAPVPQLSDSSGSKANIAMYWANVVNAKSSSKNQTWDFLNFLTQEQQLQTLSSTMINNNSTEIGILYPRKSMSSQQSNDKYLGVYASSLSNAKSWPTKDDIAVKDEFELIFTENASLSEVQVEVNKIL